MSKKDNLIWMDLEFTGLSDEQVIIESACIITDKNLEVLEEGPNIVINRTEEELKIIEDWPLKVHTESGLLEKVKNSKINISEADDLNFKFISQWVDENKGILCGNSIHIDRRYIHKEMPKLDNYLSYRMIDVSSFKEVIKRWFKPNENEPSKKNNHLALDDIRESIDELKWYKENYFKL
ncbi:MAG: oligoribonuclease [Chloroflexi bacterium]|jgi:oligoribonuclease|nr:oligoribonuclease [Chloroflexota bacterium]MBP05212.1 oligoribonuclease [Chloroflexota bacterium]|tara:strand:- start:731 stop:1270 length:540 start_codon:yes stop_codon:yes gene_type:complete